MKSLILGLVLASSFAHANSSSVTFSEADLNMISADQYAEVCANDFYVVSEGFNSLLASLGIDATTATLSHSMITKNDHGICSMTVSSDSKSVFAKIEKKTTSQIRGTQAECEKQKEIQAAEASGVIFSEAFFSAPMLSRRTSCTVRLFRVWFR